MRLLRDCASWLAIAGAVSCVRPSLPPASVCAEAIPITPHLDTRDEVYVIPESITFGDGRLLVLGPPVQAIRRTGRDDATMEVQPGAGVLMDGRGNATLVPAPDRFPEASFASVAYQQGRGWSVVWAQVDPPARSFAPGHVFFARFDGTRWQEEQQVADFEHLVGPDAKSGLVVWDGGLAVAFAAERSATEGDITILIRDSRGWHSRVVLGTRRALGVALAVKGQRWVLAYAGADASGQPSLFTLSSPDAGMTWSSPTSVHHGNSYKLQLVAGRSGFDLYWLGERSPFDFLGLHIARSDSTGQHWAESSRDPRIHLDSTRAFAVRSNTDSTAVLVLRAGDGAVSLEETVLVRPTGFDPVLSENVPTPIAQAIAVDHDALYVLSGFADNLRRGIVPRLSLKRITVRCAAARR